MHRTRAFVILTGSVLAIALSLRSAAATVLWNGDPSLGFSVFKVLNVEDANHTNTGNPSPSGSNIAASTDPLYGADWQFYKAAPDLRAEAHAAKNFTAAVGNTYYFGWRFKVNSTVSDNAVFQWKTFSGTSTQNFPVILSFNAGALQLAYYAPGEVRHLLWSQPEPANQWNTIVLELNVDSDPTKGTINFWWDGVEQNLAHQGVTYVGRTFDGDSVDPKWGIYGAVGTQVTNTVTALKIGTTYSDVVPSINYMPGDFNRDGAVTTADVAAMQQALSSLSSYQTSKGLTSLQLLSIGDINGDGKITNADLQAFTSELANNAMNGPTGSGSLTAVPEPASLVPFLLGAAAIAIARGRFTTNVSGVHRL